MDGLPKPNPDDAGPIVRRPMGLPIMAGCDTACLFKVNLNSQIHNTLHSKRES